MFWAFCEYIQLFVGLVIFYFPGASLATRENYFPWHALLGLIIFIMSISTAELGLMERFVYLDFYKSNEGFIVDVSTGLAIFSMDCPSLTVVLP